MNTPMNISAVSDIKTGNTTIHLDMSVLNRILAECPEKTDALVRLAANRIHDFAVPFSRYDTGANRASIFVKTSKDNTYPTASGEAKAAAAKRKKVIETYDPTPDDPPLGTAYVAAGTDYAFFLEFGTSRMRAYPFIFPAVEKERTEFMSKFPDLFK